MKANLFYVRAKLFLVMRISLLIVFLFVFVVTVMGRRTPPVECFPLLTYDVSGFNYRIYRHLLTVGSF